MVRFRRSSEFRDNTSLLSVLLSPFKKLFALLNPGDDGIQRTPVQRIWFSIWSVVSLPFVWVGVFFAFLVTVWSTSRSGKAFLLGLPALLTVSGVLLSIAFVNHFYRNMVYNRYEGAAAKFTSGDSELAHQAIPCLKRLVREQPFEPRHQFRLAVAYEKLDEKEKSLNLMQNLAPLDETGYDRAQLWMATHLLNDPGLELEREERLAIAKKHLQQGIKSEDIALQIQLQLGLVQKELGETDNAIRNLSAIINYEFPPGADVSDEYKAYLSNAGPPLIQLLWEQGEHNTAKFYQRSIITRLRRIAVRTPDSIDAWRIIVLCQIASDEGGLQYRAAATTIEDAQRRTRSPRAKIILQTIMAEVLLNYSDALKDKPIVNKFEKRFSAIARAVEMNFRSRFAIDKLIEIAVTPNDEPEDTASNLELCAGTVDVSPMVLNVTQGVRSAINGRTHEGMTYLRIARSAAPQAAGIVDSICLRLFYGPDNRSEDALAIIGIAVDVWPEIPRFYFTSGEILMKLGRPEDAERDYKTALEQLPDHVPLRRSLVKLYEQTGDPVNAGKHRNEIKRIEQEAAEQANKRASRQVSKQQ